MHLAHLTADLNMNSLVTLMILALAGVIEGNLYNGIDYGQRQVRRAAIYGPNSALYEKIAQALANINPNGAQHEGCGVQDPEQGEVLQPAAYSQVAFYRPNIPAPSQLPTILLHANAAHSPLAVGYNSPPLLTYAAPANKVRATSRIPRTFSVPEPVDYRYHHLQTLY